MESRVLDNLQRVHSLGLTIAPAWEHIRLGAQVSADQLVLSSASQYNFTDARELLHSYCALTATTVRARA
jgi:hypothetical protein